MAINLSSKTITKPLKQVFQKSILSEPPRIKRFLMTLKKFEFELMYIPGKQSIIADILSCACISDSTQEIEDNEMEKYIHTIQINKYSMNDHKLNVYRSETAKDPILQMLIKYIPKPYL